MVKVVRYLAQYFRPRPGVVAVDRMTCTREGEAIAAVIYKPAGAKTRLPAWVVLHGLTYRGLDHPSLVRFAGALAASGHIVMVPEIRAWTRLRVAPALTRPTIDAAIDALIQRADVDAERIGVFGFSFGATQSLVSAADPTFAERVRAIAAWGGYADIERLVMFGLTGEHEWNGVHERLEPDPYGRWMITANYLTRIPGYEDMTRAADALHQLATAAGRSGIYAGDPAHRKLNVQLAESLPARERRVFELFAPVGPHDLEAGRIIAASLAQTIIATEPLMDPSPHLARVCVPVQLAHGRDDRLIPYTEMLRLTRGLPARQQLGHSITELFSHSGGTRPGLGPIGLAQESGKFAALLHRILTTL